MLSSVKPTFSRALQKEIEEESRQNVQKEVGEESRGRTDLITGVGFMVSLFL